MLYFEIDKLTKSIELVQMKPNFKAIDQTDPEFVNTRLNESDLKDISELIQKRKAAQTKIKSPKPDTIKFVRK